MSIIQDIRDKYAKLTVVLIALALVGFILTDYFSGKSRGMSGGPSNTVGVVNGKKIGFEDFNKKVAQAEESLKQQGYPAAMASQQALDQAWNQEISQVLLMEEFENLGIEVGKKELGDMLYGANAPQDIKQSFTDEKTGVFNPVLAKQNIDQKLKKGTEEEKANINAFISQMVTMRQADKYFSLLANSINFPKWMIEKQNADNSQLAKVSLVREAYSSIPDSTVKVDDSEISAYVNKNKSQFKQQESRSIVYVSFQASPSAADSAAVKNNIAKQIEAFKTTPNMSQYLAGEGSNFYDGYISGKTIQIALKDSIFKTPVGEVYGPYLDGGSYSIARVLGVKSMPDSVKVRHILIGTQTRDTASALKLVDSLRAAIAAGSSFDTLAAKFSEDPGSKDKGGVYEIPSGQMVPPFNDFAFLNAPGTKGVVKTDFGYHIMEVMTHKGGGAAYKIAYLSKEIIASQETDNSALNEANAFAADSKDVKSFDTNYEKTLKAKGILKNIATDITPSSTAVRGLEAATRSFVRSIYDADKGDVLQPERVGDAYVVAAVTEVFEEGTMSPARARLAGAEAPIRNKKKAEMLTKKIGAVTTLEDAIVKLGGNKVIEPADSLRMSSALGAGMSYEPKVIGAAFNPANKGKVVPEVIAGQQGVYVVRVDYQTTTPAAQGDVNEQRAARYQQAKQNLTNQYSGNNPITILKNAADIKDKRSARF